MNASAEKQRSAPLGQRAYDELRERILSSEILPGRFYLERDLAELLGISRTPLKEALVRLENEDLITVQPRHGIQVKPLSADIMEEIYQIITALECEAVFQLAMQGVDDNKLRAMDVTGKRMEEALNNDDIEGWARADEDFHRMLLDYCGNTRLRQTVLNFWDQSHRARYFTLRLRDKPVNSTKDHQAVIEAIKYGNADEAVRIHRQHRVNGGKALVEIIRRFRLENL